MVAREVRERRDVERHAFDTMLIAASATRPPSPRAATPRLRSCAKNALQLDRPGCRQPTATVAAARRRCRPERRACRSTRCASVASSSRCRSMLTVVVLPFVPVTPTSRSSLCGKPIRRRRPQPRPRGDRRSRRALAATFARHPRRSPSRRRPLLPRRDSRAHRARCRERRRTAPPGRYPTAVVSDS